MSNFPEDIYIPREIENLQGIIFDPTDKHNMYAEDFRGLENDIVKIEEFLLTEKRYVCMLSQIQAYTLNIYNVINTFGFNVVLEQYDTGKYRIYVDQQEINHLVSLNVGPIYRDVRESRADLVVRIISNTTNMIEFGLWDWNASQWVDPNEYNGFLFTHIEFIGIRT